MTASLPAGEYSLLDTVNLARGLLDTSGHRPLFEQPDEFARVMTGTVLAQTAARP